MPVPIRDRLIRTSTTSGNSSQNTLSLRLKTRLWADSCLFWKKQNIWNIWDITGGFFHYVLYLWLHSLCSQRSQYCRGWGLSPPWSWADLWGWWRRTTLGSTCLDGSLWWTNITCGGNGESYNNKRAKRCKTITKIFNNKTTFLPCITLKSPIWCYHIDTRWFKRKFSGKYEFSVIISPWGNNDIGTSHDKRKEHIIRHCSSFTTHRDQQESTCLKYAHKQKSMCCLTVRRIYLHMEFSQDLWLHSAWRRQDRFMLVTLIHSF